jgi:hypothetical protein
MYCAQNHRLALQEVVELATLNHCNLASIAKITTKGTKDHLALTKQGAVWAQHILEGHSRHW